ncbi:hypothetical protein RISW2_13835 [Roseivivax isoporae LMG 25204]|uniref:SH3b domain-containing protein n=1 Tax=Roseivivax isoporae LMG 25204 TaxID=1449351 RepID=X7F637_9RHOB|nr:hypothetical protein RISW2_13835 [Roseivivax isoporae LMG 25204]
MKRFILLTFAFLFWGYYELSGGNDFVPGADPTAVVAEASEAPVEDAPGQDTEEVVARADTGAILTQVAAPAAAGEATAAQGQDEVAPEALGLVLTSRTPPAEDASGSAAAPDATPAAAVAPAEPAEPARDLRAISGNVVNMRAGPGTDYAIVTQLVRDDAIEVLRDTGDGWLKIRAVETNRVGWMADFLVSAAAR